MSRLFPKYNSVRILPETLINKIAAGEVVERPSSVVKELLENSIDAGATDIRVTVKNGGKDLISIIDNGCGMNSDDAQLSLARHATSKLTNEEDLFRINTLGFRGEALASIASVSHFELLTCDDKNQSGTRLFVKGGEIVQAGKIGFPRGTKITVERLFYNTPARQKFLKTNATEFQHIHQHLIQKALAHPSIQFRLTHNQQILLNLKGGQELGTRIQQIFGDDIREILMSVKHEDSYLKFSGFISFPSKPRTSRRWQYIFVNERNVKSPSINHGIYDGYGTFLGKSQHPAFFINILVEPTEIDVNVHPAKTEIRFRNNHLIHTIFVDQISRSLKDGASRRFFGRDHSQSKISNISFSGQIDLPIEDQLTFIDQSSGSKLSKNKKLRNGSDYLSNPNSMKTELNQNKTLFQNERSGIETHPTSKKFEDFTRNNKHSYSQNLKYFKNFPEKRSIYLLSPQWSTPKKNRVLGQFREKFIIAENNKGIVFFDQSMLHERLLFEKYRDLLKKKEVSVLSLKDPCLFELSTNESDLLKQFLKPLDLSGFTISHFGGETFSISTNPEILYPKKTEDVIREFIDRQTISFKKNLGGDKGNSEEEIVENICYSVASHGALHSSQKLSQNEMEILISKWEEYGNQKTSLEGIPMFLEIFDEELRRLFKS